MCLDTYDIMDVILKKFQFLLRKKGTLIHYIILRIYYFDKTEF